MVGSSWDPREERRQTVRNLWPQRRNSYCRLLLKRVLCDCRALERPVRCFGRHSLWEA